MADEVAIILEKAAALVGEGWCQKTLAMDAVGRKVIPEDRRAVRWCLRGALYLAEQLSAVRGAALHAARNVEKMLGCASLSAWNDMRGRTQSEVVAVPRQAAQEARR